VRLLKNLSKNYVVATLNLAFQFGLFIYFSCFTSFGQVEDVKRIVKDLCSPEFHGRGYVDGGDSIAAAYISKEFKQAGLKNLTPNYYQPFSFPVNTFPSKADFFVGSKKLVVGKDIIVHHASPSYNGVLTYKIIPASFIFDEEKILDEIQAAVYGKTNNAIAFDIQNIHPDTLKIINSFKRELAQFIPVVIITNQKFTWSVSGEQLKYPIFEIQSDVADGTPITIELDAVLKTQHETKNVIGYLPAKKKTKKTIVFTAHYDHLGRLGQETYFPGANDNASGTAMLIALAKYFKENPANYNILFIAFAGEEIGLLGSKYYVEHPIKPLKEISFLLNLDIFGSGEDGITVVNGSIFVEHFDLLTEINEEKQLLTQIKSRGYAANSDHYWFTDAGVLSFFIYTMGPNRNYHDTSDTYENLSFAEVNDLTTLLATFIERVENVKVKKKKK
jgi:aminopeptidase YwaD